MMDYSSSPFSERNRCQVLRGRFRSLGALHLVTHRALLAHELSELALGEVLLRLDDGVRIFLDPFQECFGAALVGRTLDRAAHLVEERDELEIDVVAHLVVGLLPAFGPGGARRLAALHAALGSAKLALESPFFAERFFRAIGS